jgi:phosphoglycolate phosphatase-like HAD superfamily hydrolase
MSDILHQILRTIETTRAAGKLPICVFDLDGTLFITRARTLAILADFAERTGKRDLHEAVCGITVEEQRYSVLDPLQHRMPLTDADKAALLAWWRGHFFTDEWCAKDPVFAGGPEFVRACHDRGALIYYLTGRHIHGMEEGTVQALVKHGFPMFGGRAMLQLKPDFETADEPYKEDAMRVIDSLGGEVVATFENEPANSHIFADHFPQATHVLVGNTHRPDAPEPRPEIGHVHDFLM